MADQPYQNAATAAESGVSGAKNETKAKAKAARAAAKAEAKAERKAQRAEAKAEKERVKKLAEMAQEKLLEDLSASLDSSARSATFACGGTVPFKTTNIGGKNPEAKDKDDDAGHSITDGPNSEKISHDDIVIDDIQVRFGKSGEGITVVFNTNGASTPELDQLIAACQPASFGRAGEAVLDEEYRKAGKLDKSEFATSFCPYEAGIIDVITQLLVPQVKHDKHTRSVKVSLNRLHVLIL